MTNAKPAWKNLGPQRHLFENDSTQPRQEHMIPKEQNRAPNLQAPPKHMQQARPEHMHSLLKHAT